MQNDNLWTSRGKTLSVSIDFLCIETTETENALQSWHSGSSFGDDDVDDQEINQKGTDQSTHVQDIGVWSVHDLHDGEDQQTEDTNLDQSSKHSTSCWFIARSHEACEETEEVVEWNAQEESPEDCHGE